MDNAASYKYYVGFPFSNLEFEEQAAVRKGMRLGHLVIDEKRIVRFVPPRG